VTLNNCLHPIEILLVEDSPSDANLIIRYLKQSNIANHLHWVKNGETAVEYLLQQGSYQTATRPDLILLDLNLPGINGQEVLAMVKADPGLKLIPVIILTTSTSRKDILSSYKLNVNCYITKPVEVEEFRSVIRLINDFWLAAVQLPSQ
jgi:two-component system, chemotaxis family, response regulator Rcp1